MTRAALPVLIAIAASGIYAPPGCEADGPPDGSTFMEFDVIGYDFSFDITNTQATTVVTMEALTEGECVRLDFKQPDAASILMDGGPADWTNLDGLIMEVCGDTHFPRDTFTVSATIILPLSTTGQTDIGYSTARDVDGYTHHYLASWFEGCSFFGPCYDDPDDFAQITFHVTHPVGYRLLCPGQLTPGDTRSSCSMHENVPTYSGYGLAVSQGWVYTPMGSVDGLNLEMYDLFGVQAAEQVDTTALGDFLRWIQSQLGPYPYGDSLRFMIGPHYWWGFEHPGNIAISEDVAGVQGSYQDPLLHVMMHEVAHMWSGNQTTIASIYDFVWKEAVAEYLTFVFEDENLSPAHSTRTLRIWLSSAVEARYHPVPLEEPALLDYYTDVYGSGSFILGRQLEVLLGRETVLTALRATLSDGGTMSVDQLKLALESASGVDLTEYFDEWVFGAGVPRWPVLSVGLTPSGDGTYEMQVRQVQNTSFIYGLSTTIRLLGEGTNQMDIPITYGVDGTDDSLTLSVNPVFEVTGYVVDPYDEALVFGAGVDSSRFGYAPMRPF